MPIFDHDPPKIIEVTFSFLEFVSTHQKPAYSTNSFLRYNFLSPVTTVSTQIFDHVHLHKQTKLYNQI